jgi:IS5 family transposase
MRDFVGIDLSRESVPDATTLLKFRRGCWSNDLTKAPVRRDQRAPEPSVGLLMRQGTIVDATIIAAPSSTKNARASATRRCTRPRRATSGTSA